MNELEHNPKEKVGEKTLEGMNGKNRKLRKFSTLTVHFQLSITLKV